MITKLHYTFNLTDVKSYREHTFALKLKWIFMKKKVCIGFSIAMMSKKRLKRKRLVKRLIIKKEYIPI